MANLTTRARDAYIYRQPTIASFLFRAKGRWINRCLSFPSWPDHVVWCSFVNPIQYRPAYRLIGRPRDVGGVGAFACGASARLVRSFRIPHPSLNIIQQLALHFRSARQQSDTQTASEGRLLHHLHLSSLNYKIKGTKALSDVTDGNAFCLRHRHSNFTAVYYTN